MYILRIALLEKVGKHYKTLFINPATPDKSPALAVYLIKSVFSLQLFTHMQHITDLDDGAKMLFSTAESANLH